MGWRYEQLRCRVMLEDDRPADALTQSTNAVTAATATGTAAASAESLALQAEILAQTVTFMPKRQDGGASGEPPMQEEPGYGYEMGDEGQ